MFQAWRRKLNRKDLCLPVLLTKCRRLLPDTKRETIRLSLSRNQPKKSYYIQKRPFLGRKLRSKSKVSSWVKPTGALRASKESDNRCVLCGVVWVWFGEQGHFLS